MPKVTVGAIARCKEAKISFKKIIKQKMIEEYTQEELGKAMGISQSWFSQKISNADLNIPEFARLVSLLHFSDDEIIKVIRSFAK